jgi:hypothetical protein
VVWVAIVSFLYLQQSVSNRWGDKAIEWQLQQYYSIFLTIQHQTAAVDCLMPLERFIGFNFVRIPSAT